MRYEEGMKKEASKVKQTNKAKQHSTPKAVTFPRKNELPQYMYICMWAKEHCAKRLVIGKCEGNSDRINALCECVCVCVSECVCECALCVCVVLTPSPPEANDIDGSEWFIIS